MAGCGGGGERAARLRFWAMGREGEVVEEIVRDFERENPDIRVDVQQIPWSAAHEKLLTSYVGRSTPDVAQLGNTWVSEFAALRALEPLDPWVEGSPDVDSSGYFPGIWDTNRIEGVLYGIPWYVDTRVLFYRKDILAAAGWEAMPATWAEWRKLMEAVKRSVGEDRFAVFLPTNEPTQPIIFGLQAGSPLLEEDATRGAFSEPAFLRAFRFYIDLFRDGLAPPVSNTEIANLYQEFERGYFAMYITGPWNLGEFRRRIAPDLQDEWSTAPLPGPDAEHPGVSLAGGSSLVVFRTTRRPEASWRLVEFLSRPEQQVRFYRLTGDLPARREAWDDTTLTADPKVRAFREQLDRVVATPKVPEWEQIAMRLRDRAEEAIRGARDPEAVLEALDNDVDRILEKRRWLLERRLRGGGEREPEGS
ncbi:MAG: sugar ABC transporter substrate-binding protein [Candidatus Eisenbacteria bacterium]